MKDESFSIMKPMSETLVLNTTETDPDILIDKFFLTFLGQYPAEDEARIRSAWSFLIERTRNLKRSCGKPYYLHPMRVACILAQARLGYEAVVAGLLHNILEVEPDCFEEIGAKFGKEIADICFGTSKITSLKIKRMNSITFWE